MPVAARTAGSQESNVQDVPALAKQSLSAAETSVRVTRARALQAAALPAPCSGGASSPAIAVTKCAAARKWPGSLRTSDALPLWPGSLLPQRGSVGAAQG